MVHVAENPRGDLSFRPQLISVRLASLSLLCCAFKLYFCCLTIFLTWWKMVQNDIGNLLLYSMSYVEKDKQVRMPAFACGSIAALSPQFAYLLLTTHWMCTEIRDLILKFKIHVQVDPWKDGGIPSPVSFGESGTWAKRISSQRNESLAVQWTMGRQLTVSLTLSMSSKACHFEDAIQDWSQI